MPKLVNVFCNNCNSPFSIELKRYNENIKMNWKFYCSSSCKNQSKLRGKFIKCSNIKCDKLFYRNNKNIKLNNYCSNSCAAKINNFNKVRNPHGFNNCTSKNKNLVKKVFSFEGTNYGNRKYNKVPKYCLRPFCYNKISLRSKYCSVTCQRIHQSPKLYEYRNLVLTKIHSFVYSHSRIPTKRELDCIYKIACKVFGSWNKAIESAGYTPNPVLFANKHVALDGHKCDSFAEMIIDNWLFDRGIEHSINISYPENNRYTVDFKVDDYWIEYFGLLGSVTKYKKSFEMKLKLSKKYNIKLIKIYPSDLFPVCNLDTLLEPVVMHYSKSLVMV